MLKKKAQFWINFSIGIAFFGQSRVEICVFDLFVAEICAFALFSDLVLQKRHILCLVFKKSHFPALILQKRLIFSTPDFKNAPKTYKLIVTHRAQKSDFSNLDFKNNPFLISDLRKFVVKTPFTSLFRSKTRFSTLFGFYAQIGVILWPLDFEKRRFNVPKRKNLDFQPNFFHFPRSNLSLSAPNPRISSFH